MGHKQRIAANKDLNETQIVSDLREIGVSVERDHDDILCGFQGLTFWYELKSKNALKKDGSFRKGAVKDGQKLIDLTWRGHYKIVSSLTEIIADMNDIFSRCGLRTVRITGEL